MAAVDFAAAQPNQTRVSDPDLLDQLPTVQRFALAYSPAQSRPAVLGLLVLDTRLAGVVRSAREPVLGQLRLAWWREALEDAARGVMRAEPLLGRMAPWREETAALLALVDGWEALLTAGEPGEAGIAGLAEGRAAAFAGLARVVGAGGSAAEARRAGANWALGDMAARLSDPGAVTASQNLARDRDWRRPVLPRTMRSLLVLHGLARRAVLGDRTDLLGGPGALLTGIRLGLLGR